MTALSTVLGRRWVEVGAGLKRWMWGGNVGGGGDGGVFGVGK